LINHNYLEYEKHKDLKERLKTQITDNSLLNTVLTVVEEEVLSQGSPLKKDSRHHSSSFRPIFSPKKQQASNDRIAEFEEEEEEEEEEVEEEDDEEGADPMAIIPAAEYSINEVITFLSMQEQQGKSLRVKGKSTAEKVMYLQISKLVS
jgi:CO dehydrogenase/acetyl-CoA synthase beta subunit